MHTQQIKEAYAEAAKERLTLCSTNSYSGLDLSWVPEEVLHTNQGCASPVAEAKNDISSGQVVLDLGCGAGLDVFLASKAVGPEGHVYGVDMTPEMLAIGRRNKEEVAKNLGYVQSNVTFHEAVMEDLPVDSEQVDTVISNCVINLSNDKPKVFQEIFRVLKPGGRFVISDLLSIAELPLYIHNSQALINRCMGRALSIRGFLDVLHQCGFRGLTLVTQKSYCQVDGYDFLSLTLSAFKPASVESNGKRYATLIGPCSSVVDELGNRYERGRATEVTAETAALLGLPRYRSYFFLASEPRDLEEAAGLGIPPEPGPCVYTGDFVTLVGPFTEVSDDDGHTFKGGVQEEICGKTLNVLSSPLYKQLFVMINRCHEELEAAQVECGPGCC